MPSVMAQVADAVVGELNDAKLSIDITPERSYAEWDEELTELNTLRVDVVPVGLASAELSARNVIGYDVDVDIGIRYRFGPADTEAGDGRIAIDEIDALVLLVEEIVEYLSDSDNSERRLSDYTSASLAAMQVRATYVREHLRTLGQFTAIIRATYSADKQL